MQFNGRNKEPILIVGEGRLCYSVTVCLAMAGYTVTLFTEDKETAAKNINIHFTDLSNIAREPVKQKNAEITDSLENGLPYKLVVVVTGENVLKKRKLIQKLEEKIPANSILAINTESIPLSVLQKGSKNPERIIGVNWSEPAHTTYFLELIANDKSNTVMVDNLFQEAKLFWNKDPYIIFNDLGIRSKLLTALTREAFYLLENGFASIEDIDRACRNDPGYYLPFAGNFRYMDLMGGPVAYGRVMKDLNPELTKLRHIPDFFMDLIEKAEQCMENNKAIYEYKNGDTEKWDETFRKFSYEVKAVIEKYPFKYPKQNPSE
ncbi:MAG: 3-hydroxyacyl-CoA dehydrogenase NAD-binding domain-containing protein [Chitinophagaceae bacterium]